MPCTLVILSEVFAKCQATSAQERVTEDQCKLLRTFLDAGNKDVRLREHVLKKLRYDEEYWDQMLIFLGLACVAPRDRAFSPSKKIDEVWHQFILCTREYGAFCTKVRGGMIHHVPNALSDEKPLPPWFLKDGIKRFLDGMIPEFVPRFWEDEIYDCVSCNADCRTCNSR